MPLFCGTSLARRIESAEAHLILAATEAARRRGAKGLAIPVAGGFACFAESASPMNKVVGLGFDGVPDGAAWDEMERAMFACGVAVQVELSNLADPDVAALLADRGYRLVGFENVLGHGLRLNAEPAAPHGIEVRATNDIDAWVDVVVEGFAHPDSADSANEGVPSHEEFPRDVIDRAERDFEQAGAIAYVAMCDGVIAGGGSVRLTDGIAQLTGAATAPAFRRRGVQTALLAARLWKAAQAGCDIAVVATAPGSTSQKNVQNNGFQLLYTRAVMVKAPPPALPREHKRPPPKREP
ncbi:GNAT family N-acetyltransferase [Mycolicibacterium komossense]|uniref:GNAT family N-acetyltransferase n=1 Tax=Mycolicibacterium komossense TaxID=1779 RepID=A0ABT3C8T0_9MYCO|nr:GNAT family N-acetyltransferase [Mycolicibacterium komossense]MCV7225631.1 GNAT family N-acetyltransferase [Mycolicibacterium komossense]